MQFKFVWGWTQATLPTKVFSHKYPDFEARDLGPALATEISKYNSNSYGAGPKLPYLPRFFHIYMPILRLWVGASPSYRHFKTNVKITRGWTQATLATEVFSHIYPDFESSGLGPALATEISKHNSNSYGARPKLPSYQGFFTYISRF